MAAPKVEAKIYTAIVLDFETGGLDPKDCAVTQIAMQAVRMDSWELLESYQNYVKPYNQQDHSRRKVLKNRQQLEIEIPMKYEVKALEYSGVTMDLLRSRGVELSTVASDIIAIRGRCRGQLSMPPFDTELASKRWTTPFREVWIRTKWRLASMDFLRNNRDLFITGPTGTGKSYLATALGYRACQEGFRVLYASTARLISALKIAKAKGVILNELKRIEKCDLLILDDFAMQGFDAQGRSILMDVIEDRHSRHSTLLTSQLPVSQWHAAIGEKTVADAVLDRLAHNALRVELYGESVRKRKKMSNIY